MIQQTFGVLNRSCKMVRYKQKSLIPDITADKVVYVDKKRDIAANKKLQIAVEKAVKVMKEQNTAPESSILKKNQIIRRTKLTG